MALKGEESVEFELANMGTVFRHSSILGCYCNGKPSFARKTSVANLLDLWSWPRTYCEIFELLYAFPLVR